ncbi:amino acid permease, partial [bacterium]|nr:amino acid permease [bacterium]
MPPEVGGQGNDSPQRAGTRTELARTLGLYDTAMIGVAAMIGAGIFVLTGRAAGVAGPAFLLAFFLNGLVAFLTAGAYAELGAAYPEAGGPFVWVRAAYSRVFAFLTGWLGWASHIVA